MAAASADAGPTYAWGLDPTFWAHMKLTNEHVLRLGEGAHALNGRPVHRVFVVGTVVARVIGSVRRGTEKYVKHLLDDGTGLLTCTTWDKERESSGRESAAFGLGYGVAVAGRLSHYKGVVEVNVESIRLARPNEEQLHWLSLSSLGREYYAQTFDGVKYVDEAVLAKSIKGNLAQECSCGCDYGRTLVYCKCLASPVDVDDGQFAFRDAILRKLITLEDSVAELPISTALEDVSKSAISFSFQNICSDPSLIAVAESVLEGVSSARTAAVTSERVKSLFRKVIKAFREDGIVYLKNNEDDVYQFVSRRRVLEPAIRRLCREMNLRLDYGDRIVRELQKGLSITRHVSGGRIRTTLLYMRESAKE